MRVQFLNLARGLAKESKKQKGSGLALLALKAHYPDLIAYTELFGPSGTADLRQWLGQRMSGEYSTMLWSQRSVGKDGVTAADNNAGGGIALLVHKRLNVVVRELDLAADPLTERPLLDGHLRVYRLDPAQLRAGGGSVGLKPIVVTLAYIPPKGGGDGWGKKLRPLMARVIRDSDDQIAELRQTEDLFAFTLAHTNAPDRGCDVELVTPDTVDAQLDGLQKWVSLAEAAKAESPNVTRATLSTQLGAGRLLLHRTHLAKERLAADDYGVELVQAAARSGKCPLTGVFSRPQPDSWLKTGMPKGGRCPACVAGKVSECELRKSRKKGPPETCALRLKMRSFHDVVWVPSSLVLQALTVPRGGRDLVSLVTRRVLWADGTPIDHAVTSVRLFVGPVQRVPRAGGAGEVGGASSGASHGGAPKQPRRVRLPDNLRFRASFRSSLATHINNRFAPLAKEPGTYDVDDRSVAVVDGLRAALDDAMLTREDHDVENDPKFPGAQSERRCRAAVNRCNDQISVFLRRHPPSKRNLTPASRAAFKTTRDELNAKLVSAKRVLENARRSRHGAMQTERLRSAPRAHWQRQRLAGQDPGAPALATTWLLDHQTDDKGVTVATRPAHLKSRIQQNRQQMFDVPACDNAELAAKVDEALAELHVENRAHVDSLQGEVDVRSAAAVSAADAAAPMKVADERLGLKRDLQAAIAAARVRRLAAGHPLRIVADDLVGAVRERDRAFSPAEVSDACSLLEDTGAGIDGLPPAMLGSAGDKDSALNKVLCDLFNRAFRSGKLPDTWQVHRMLLLYKGKNSDPFHVGNYRGIGLDHLLLKVWSLLLNARLEVFVDRTGALSPMQGGFQRLRGTPESVITLTEAVRATTLGKTGADGRMPTKVELVFIDVVAAYDSALHPLLWKCCMDKGIGGHFLAALQAVYHEASARVDLKGELLNPVALLRGVLQGNPLSPLLFNLYLDGVIGKINALTKTVGVQVRPVGLWFPRDGAAADSIDHRDYLPCQFFADDGTLLEADHDTLQRMVDLAATALATVGMRINVAKTKWMIVPPHYVTEAAYKEMKTAALLNPLRVYGKDVELVDEFDYLGVRVWWRWNFDKAWEAATHRARKQYFGALRGGWQRRAGSLATQLDYARAKIFSHFNYVAAIAGAAGLKSSAPWRKSDEVVGWVLRTITGLRHANVEALKIEAGWWAHGLHIQMLQTRLWLKGLTMPPDSMFARAVRLSIQFSNSSARSRPVESQSKINELHRQTWAQQLMAATDLFQIPRDDVYAGTPHLVEVHSRASDDDAWAVVLPGGDISPTAHVCLVPVRLPARAADRITYTSGFDCWRLPNGTSRVSALGTWTEPLRAASYAALRERGNAARGERTRAFLAEQIRDDTRLASWARSVPAAATRMQPYWKLDDAQLARWLLKARFDQCPTEDYVRTAPHGKLKRIPERIKRSCYTCNGIAPGIYWPDTFVHVCVRCNHSRLARLRDALRERLAALADDAVVRKLTRGVNDGKVPDFADDSTFYTVLQLCTGVGPTDGTQLLQAEPLPASAPAAARRAAPQLRRNQGLAHVTVAWMQCLFHDWLGVSRDPARFDERPQDSPGYRLALLVARHIKSVFDARRSALSHSTGFKARDRDDPVQPLPAPPPAPQVPPAGDAAAGQHQQHQAEQARGSSLSASAERYSCEGDTCGPDGLARG